ncbi:tyrosine-type recombinase/integrase [Mariniflexile soesokkakense]|uniref:Tyrosine-type recombinase/integrase n=1 Tax=Mariniflexile soesokkakense TaxID=1343160 RepID=A0ABV0AH24_9FLAO
MASVNYRLKTNSDWNTIYLRFKQGSQFDYEVATDFSVPKNRWSKPKQEVLSTKEVDSVKINIKLNELKAFIIKAYEDSKADGAIITNNWLKEQIAIFLNKETQNTDLDNKIFITNFIETFIKDSEKRKTKKGELVLKRTIQHYRTTKNKIQAFENSVSKRYKLTDIDLKFHSGFLEYLKDTQHLRNSTIGGYIDDIRLFCRTADKMGYNVSNEYKLNEFYSPSYETKDIYLTTEEIKKIYNKSIENESLTNAKDWFVIGLYTGLRVSDLLKLSSKNIDDDFITLTTKKTSFPVIIPIHPHIREILKKRNGKFPRKISDQKFNDYIKIVCEKVGFTEFVEGSKMCPKEIVKDGKKKIIHRKIDGKYPKFELISSHICRRSFASNLYGKIDTLTIMKITGHKTESQFLKYIKITPKEYAIKLKEHWKENKHLFD